MSKIDSIIDELIIKAIKKECAKQVTDAVGHDIRAIAYQNVQDITRDYLAEVTNTQGALLKELKAAAKHYTDLVEKAKNYHDKSKEIYEKIVKHVNTDVIREAISELNKTKAQIAIDKLHEQSIV